MKNKDKDLNIGKRAAKAIREMCWRKGFTYTDEMRKLGIASSTMSRYEKGEINPSAEVLKRMALNGYDIIFILTNYERSDAKSV